ncbi:MAG: hypothetical protein ACIAQF_00530 [Phycisphaerales bacterium JB065]
MASEFDEGRFECCPHYFSIDMDLHYIAGLSPQENRDGDASLVTNGKGEAMDAFAVRKLLEVRMRLAG